METSAYLDSLRQDIVFNDTLCGLPFTFHTTWGLFSPREIDDGSRLLLQHIELPIDADCLDIGCGYGTLGLTLARLAPQGRTLLVDKDFVAIDYCRKNIQLNGIGNAEAMLSNGLGAIGERRFDIIVSNLPAKVGKELLQLLLHDAHQHLNPGGRLYVVTITGLRRFIQRHFIETFGNYDKLKQGAHYTVAMACKTR
ncbi:MAG: methyltransferase [Gammaproteobacteria bacterium]|nr:methyltransferase [Gammaproteobacteria bacterium]